jgi:nucleoside-diphosphate-sugar epimerase
MSQRIFIAGAAGLVGQNLIAQLARSGEFALVGADKHARNTQALRELHPDLEVIEADLAEPGSWQDIVADCDALIMLQAQIGGLDPAPFERNNVVSTRLLLEAAGRGRRPFVIHVSSSVVNSMAHDLYTESKKLW